MMEDLSVRVYLKYFLYGFVYWNYCGLGYVIIVSDIFFVEEELILFGELGIKKDNKVSDSY